ncbi:MAG: ATP-dependent helicase HrpB [Bosea sp. (in: a-proteobacteria)]
MRAADEPALPIDEALPALKDALVTSSRAVLVAPPGAGKTTRVPLALLNEGWVKGRQLIVLEPRRLAARAAAERMAATLGESVGERVGLRVRFGSKVSARTRIEVVTEGVFVRMILDDPELSGIAAVLFDEFHERSLDADLGLALALDAQGGLRDDLRLLVMSATLDGARVAALLGDAPIIESQGRAFPVETRHRPRDPLKRLEEEVGASVMTVLADETGSILVFLPGQAEIRRLESWLSERIRNPAIVIAPLYGAMDRASQDAAIRTALDGTRKIVLATSIAETSLTIDGVRVVIDSGLARVPVHEPDVGVTRLATVKISRAAADQRRGRAGRTQPGICYRLWPEAATMALEAYARPEILAADLAPLLLDCAAWGVSDPANLHFLDAPPAAALKEARALLEALGALDEAGRLSGKGKAMRALPVAPRLAAMILAAREAGDGLLAGELAVLLSEQGLGGDGTDIEERLSRFRRERGQRADEARRMAANLAGGKPSSEAGHCAGYWLAKAYPDRIAKQRGAEGHFIMANGRGGRLEPHERLARAPWLVIADLTGTAQNARILAAAALDESELEGLAGDKLQAREEISFDAAARALRCRRVKRLGAILLSEQPLPVPTSGEAAQEASAVLARGIAALPPAHWPWSAASRQWRDRVAFLHAADRESWPDVSDAALALSMESWLGPHLPGIASLSAIGADRFFEALKGLIDWNMQRRLDAEAPTHLTAPTGSRLSVDYAAEAGPTVSVRVQELFGLGEHPALANGRIPVVLELLSPAHRPIQVTRDLPGFWRGSWAAVRSEMRGRYPRHVWPEDPAGAQATTRAKPRGT